MVDVQRLLLAAGASRRMGRPKQLLPWGTETLIEHQIKTLLETNHSLSVILGAYAEKITGVIEKFPIDIYVNQDWEEGMGSSIAFGVKKLLEKDAGADGILITLIDQPFLTSTYFKKVLDTFQPDKEQIIVSNAGSHWSGAPVLFDKVYFKELLKLNGDKGAKVVATKYKDAVKLIDAGNMLIDIDTPETYIKLLGKFTSTN